YLSRSSLEIDKLLDSILRMQHRVSNNHSALKMALEKVKQLNRELENKVAERTNELILERDKANLLAAQKTRFLSNMSHEIRTPLTVIKGLVEQMLKNSAPKNTQELLCLEQNTAHLQNVIDDV